MTLFKTNTVLVLGRLYDYILMVQSIGLFGPVVVERPNKTLKKPALSPFEEVIWLFFLFELINIVHFVISGPLLCCLCFNYGWSPYGDTCVIWSLWWIVDSLKIISQLIFIFMQYDEKSCNLNTSFCLYRWSVRETYKISLLSLMSFSILLKEKDSFFSKFLI